MMPEKSPSNSVRVGLLVLRSNDMDRAAAFYSALGLRLLKHSHPPCGEHYATTNDDCVFEIYKRSKDHASIAPSFFGLNVPDVENAVKVATDNGAALIRSAEESDWGMSATIRDPDGNKVILIESR